MNKKIIQQIWLPTLLVLSCLCTPFTSVYAQNIRVTIQLKDVRMKLVMTEIEKQTRYLFAIDDDVDVTRSVSVNVVNQPLQEALIQMVKGSDVSYQISGSNIVLKKKPIQKPVTVSGTVLDQNKQPVCRSFRHRQRYGCGNQHWRRRFLLASGTPPHRNSPTGN